MFLPLQLEAITKSKHKFQIVLRFSYGADEASSLDESFEDASSNRLSSYIQGYPSVDEEESRLGAVSGRGMSGGGGGKSGVSWRRQRSTRISALLTSGNSTDRSSTYSWGEDVSSVCH